MNYMNEATIRSINEALYFTSNEPYEQPAVRPWQYVRMEYERVGMTPPARMPQFETVDDAQIWMCLDGNYNTRLREISWPVAV